jgi:hypothetical protein
MAKFELTVGRGDLADGMEIATVGVRKGKPGTLRFSFDGVLLQLTGPGASKVVAADGDWPAAVTVDAAIMQQVATRLPNQDPLILKVENNRLYIGGFSVGAEIADIAPPPVDLPIDHSSADIMVALAKLGEPRVIGTIGRIAVEKAKRELDGKVLAAVRHLSPYGVKSADIEPVVHQAIKRRAGLG